MEFQPGWYKVQRKLDETVDCRLSLFRYIENLHRALLAGGQRQPTTVVGRSQKTSRKDHDLGATLPANTRTVR